MQEQEEEKEQQERTQRLTDLAKTQGEKERKDREAMERKEALALTSKHRGPPPCASAIAIRLDDSQASPSAAPAEGPCHTGIPGRFEAA